MLKKRSERFHRGSFLEGPEKFLHPGSRSKMRNLTIAELFYSHILDMNRGSLQGVSGMYTSLFLDTDYLKLLCRPENVPGLSRNSIFGSRGVTRSEAKMSRHFVSDTSPDQLEGSRTGTW